MSLLRQGRDPALAHLRTALVILTQQNEQLGRLLTIVIDQTFADVTGRRIADPPPG